MAVFTKKIAEQFDIPQTCSFCGGDEVQAFWHGADSVRTCLNCAFEIFPQLLADAITSMRKCPALEGSIVLFFERAKANFHQACVKSLLRIDNEK